MLTQETRYKAAKLTEECKQLLDEAAQEKRDLTAEEAEQFDKKMEEVQAIHAELGGSYISRREAMEAAAELMSRSQGYVVGPRALESSNQIITSQQNEFCFNDENKYTRTLEPAESVRSLLEARPNFDPELSQLRFGQIMRALATGSRSELERRALSMGIDTAGGYTVPSILVAQVIDLMRARLVLGRAGVRFLPLEGGEMSFATVAEDPDPKWRGENQPVSEEEVIFGSLTLRPRVIAMIVKSSRELLESSPNIESLLENTLARVMAGKIDRACLIGENGPVEPTGVANWPGIHTHAHDANGNYAMILQGRKKMLMANSDDPTACILSARDEANISMLKDGQGLPLPRPPVIANLPILPTTNIPVNLGAGDNESIAVVGDFRSMIIAQKVALHIQILHERYANNLQVGFLVWAMLDCAIEQPEAFCKITGLVDPV